METLKKRIPHTDLLQVLPDLDGYIIYKCITENIGELCEVDVMSSIRGSDLYYDTDFDGVIFMLTPNHCQFIIEKIMDVSNDFRKKEEDSDD
jgi:hypothetical protein